MNGVEVIETRSGEAGEAGAAEAAQEGQGAANVRTDSEVSDELAQVLRCATAMAGAQKGRTLALDPDNLRQGLGQLVLTLVKLLHELLERQALRRIEGGALTDKQIEDVGYTLMRQSEEIARLAKEFDLKDADLNLDLGPIGRLF